MNWIYTEESAKYTLNDHLIELNNMNKKVLFIS